MAKRKSHPGKPVGAHTFAGRKFNCAGKRVRAGKSSKRVPRIFCRKEKTAGAKRGKKK